MSELDKLKEEITHLRMWLGILVVIDLSLTGWLAAQYGSATNLLIVLDISGILVISGLIWALNRMIETRIDQLKDL